jgi:hypothetical protein
VSERLEQDSRNSVKPDKNIIKADPATIGAWILAILLVPLILVGIFSH